MQRPTSRSRMSVIAIVILAALLTSACGTTTQWRSVENSYERIDRPPVDQKSTVELGFTLLLKLSKQERKELRLANELTKGDGFFTFALHADPGTYTLEQENDSFLFFFPTRGNSMWCTYRGLSLRSGIRVSKTGHKPPVLFSPSPCPAPKRNGSNNILYGIPREDPEFIIRDVEILGVRYFRQELIYNGRVANHVRFIYREASPAGIREAYTQELQYDLSESDIIGFRGARIQIFDATNIELTYKVLATFPDS